MIGDSRRKKLVQVLNNREIPISGTALAEKFQVSRQVIVQDIALLRAENKNILSTNKGYVMFKSSKDNHAVRKVFLVKHSTEEVLEELYCIVDLGGKMMNLSVEHEIYGLIEVDLIIRNRRDAKEFVEKLKVCGNKPLKELTSDVHYHTVEADTEEVLMEIESILEDKGFLIRNEA